MREIATVPDKPLDGNDASHTLGSGWPAANPMKPTGEEPHQKNRERRRSAKSRAVNHTGIVVNYVGIRSQTSPCPALRRVDRPGRRALDVGLLDNRR